MKFFFKTMPPKVKPVMSDECNAILSQMNEQFTSLKTEFSLLKSELVSIKSRLDEFQNFKDEVNDKLSDNSTEIENLKGEISTLKSLIDDGDAYERKDTIILSGEKIPTAATGEHCPSLVQKLVKDELKINLPADAISTAHRLGRRPGNQSADKRNLIVKLVRRDLKHELISASKRQPRPKKLFVSESLPPSRQTIVYALRKMTRAKLIKGCNSYDGRIYAFTASTNPEERDKRHLVNCHDSLKSFCAEYVRRPLEDFLESWQH